MTNSWRTVAIYPNVSNSIIMKDLKEHLGWVEGTVQEFLGLTDEEMNEVEIRVTTVPLGSRIKILYRKNLKMTSGKIAAQAVHAGLGLAWFKQLDPAKAAMMSVVVLGVSDTKFREAKESHFEDFYVVRDAGYTEIPAGTETCLAFLEEANE